MNSITEKFFSLVRYAIFANDTIPQLEPREWQCIYSMSHEQSIAGVVFCGVERLNKDEVKIPRELLFNWIGDSEQIKQQNLLLNKRCVELVGLLRNDGYDSRILKGQGNATMYPCPYSRTPGDIDVWIRKKSGEKYKKNDVIWYARKSLSEVDVRFHHVEYEWNGVLVELHFVPGIMNNPWYSRRLQRWYKCHTESTGIVELPDGVGKIPVPTNEFNIVFQLAHMMHHFFDEGIGLRQMIDYYYLLKSDGRSKMDDVEKTLKYLNLDKFAGAVMYIMTEVLGLEEKYQIVPMDERRGKTLLREIMNGGNFGHSSGLARNNMAKKYFQKTWRNMQLVKEYPAEALCEPVFRTWHYFWRLLH